MDDRVKIYDTLNGCESVMFGNFGENGTSTITSNKIKKSHWASLFSWKKKNNKESMNIIDVFTPHSGSGGARSTNKFSSLSAATGIAYNMPPPPGRLPPAEYSSKHLANMQRSQLSIHASIKTTSPNKQRGSLFYTPWESLHQQTPNGYANHCTCFNNSTSRQLQAAGDNQRHSTSCGFWQSGNNSQPKLSRIQLYSVTEETDSSRHHDLKSLNFKSKSTDSLHQPNNLVSNRIKSYKSSTTLSNSNSNDKKLSNGTVSMKNKANGSVKVTSTSNKPATVNERFLRFLKKSADPFSSVASRKSILECEISAYDLIKEHLKDDSIDDLDDSLSDNAIEDENHREMRIINVGNQHKPNRKSITSKSLHLIESVDDGNFYSECTETGINLVDSSPASVRIAGYGMNIAADASMSLASHFQCKINPNNNSAKPLGHQRSSSTFELVIPTSEEITKLWTDEFDECSYNVPEPDYDTDENEIDLTSEMINADSECATKSFDNLLQLNVSPALSKDKHDDFGQEQVVQKKINVNTHLKSKSTAENEKVLKAKHLSGSQPNIAINNYSQSQEGCNHSDESKPKSKLTPTKIVSPKVPPPPPPTTRTAIKQNANISYQNELKDKLNSGVKSILKKSSSHGDISKSLIQPSTNQANDDRRASDDQKSQDCDYIKTFKEFKEARLLGRQRKHVHFRSRCDDTLIVDHIRNETILEVDESEEPIYDDVEVPEENAGQAMNESNHHKNDFDSSESSTDAQQSRHKLESTETKDDKATGTGEPATDKAKETTEFDKSGEEDPSSQMWMKRIDPIPSEANSVKLVSDTSRSPSPGADDAIPLANSRPTVLKQSRNTFSQPKAITADGYFKNSCDSASYSLNARRPSTTPTGTLPDITSLDQVGRRQKLSSSLTQINATRSAVSSSFSSSGFEKSDMTIDNGYGKHRKQLTLPVCQEDFHNKKNANGKVRFGLNHQAGNNNTEIENSKQTKSVLDPSDSCVGSETGSDRLQSQPAPGRPPSLFSCTISIRDKHLAQVSDTTSSINSKATTNHHPSGDYKSSPLEINPDIDQEQDINPLSLITNSKDKIVINVPLDKSNYEANCIQEHIYEELDRQSIYFDTQNDLESPRKSIFEGASKDEILDYLEDAKERVEILIGEVEPELIETIDVIETIGVVEEVPMIHTKLTETLSSSNRRNRTSNVSNSSTDSSATTSSSVDIEDDLIKCTITSSVSAGQLVERNDSGVGTETKNKPMRLKKAISLDEVEHQCADCDNNVEPIEEEVTGLLHYPLFCLRCDKKRSERKEIISEIVDTEFKYGRDLRIIREEFYRPIEIAGLLSKEQLKGVFLNLDELISVNSRFSEKLQDAIDIATEQGDEDFTTINIGKLFHQSSDMLHTFEYYCVRQGSAALLLNHLEKEKELLRIFLRVSQMENTLLRRMNLRSFLVVPVQRVTKYPLLLNRLYKVTPYHHRDREAIREAQQKVELHLEHINQQTKGVGATNKIWRRISNLSASHRRLDDIGNIKIRKAALEILKWNQDETQFVTIGKLLFLPITDYTINKRAKTLKFLTASALLVTLGRPNENYRPDLVNTGEADRDLMFPRGNTGINDAVLLLIKEKGGRYVLCREPLHLGSCVIGSESDSDEMFEIHENSSKDAYLFKAELPSETKDWLKQLRYHCKDLGHWRRRRNALANIMMMRQ